MIKAGIETIGPKITKTSVNVGSVTLSPLTGKGQIKGLVIGNPHGFTSEAAIKVKDFTIKIVPSSLKKRCYLYSGNTNCRTRNYKGREKP